MDRYSNPLGDWLAQQLGRSVEPTPKPPVNPPDHNLIKKFVPGIGSADAFRQRTEEEKVAERAYENQRYPRPAPESQASLGNILRGVQVNQLGNPSKMQGRDPSLDTPPQVAPTPSAPQVAPTANAPQVAPTAQASQVPPTANGPQAFPVDGRVTGQNPNSQQTLMQKFMQGMFDTPEERGFLSRLGGKLVEGPSVGPGGEYRNALSNTAAELNKRSDDKYKREGMARNLANAGMPYNKALAMVQTPEGQVEAQKALVAAPGENAFSKEFSKQSAKEAVEWMTGGRAKVQAHLSKLGQVEQYLGSNDTHMSSLPIAGDAARALLPSTMIALLSKEGGEYVYNKELAESVAAESLKEILGGQFTENEGNKLLKRLWNPVLSNEQNLSKVRELNAYTKELYKQKDSIMQMSSRGATPQQIMEAERQMADEAIKRITAIVDKGGSKGDSGGSANKVHVVGVRKTNQ